MSSTTAKAPDELATASKLSVLSNRAYVKSSSLLNAVARKYYDNEQYNYRLIIHTVFVGLTLISTIIFLFSQFRGISSNYCKCKNLTLRGRIINGENVGPDELPWVASLLKRIQFTRCSYERAK